MTARAVETGGIVAPLPEANVDTDRIIPARYLRGTSREGLGRYLFAGNRYRDDGSEDPVFVLNREPYRGARILVAHENFGCGSSREHAVWALRDFGIVCVIAVSFADIFFANCCRNGLPALRLPRAACDRLIADAQRDPVTNTLRVDLAGGRVVQAMGESFRFDLEPAAIADLLDRVDAVERTMAMGAAITAFEHRHLPRLAALPPLRFA